MPKKIAKRAVMPKQEPEQRISNFLEVAKGFTKELAVKEASRCIQCKKPKCVQGCPVEIDIPAFLNLIAEGKHLEAGDKIKEKNSLPGICGRVCPQESQCEAECILGVRQEPIAIGALERFAADWQREKTSDLKIDTTTKTKQGKKVAVIGSGPAGITAAADLAKFGYKVTMFESLHETGGVLIYGIPNFRLPKEILKEEVDYVESLGVEIVTNVVIGQTLTLEDLFNDGYEAVFIGTGAGLPYFLNIPGENLNGVYSANEFLTRVNLMKAYEFPKYDTPVEIGEKVAVVGAGNVAMDSARVARRIGAKEVSIVYRRSRVEMPARQEEIENAEEEGIILRLLTNPVRILGKDGCVTGIECLKMELGEPDESGRRRPVPIDGSEFVLDVDIIIIAIGQGPNPLLVNSAPELEVTKWGNIAACEETGRTSMERVYAGGDIVTGAATVISAMGAGKRAARAIHEDLST